METIVWQSQTAMVEVRLLEHACMHVLYAQECVTPYHVSTGWAMNIRDTPCEVIEGSLNVQKKVEGRLLFDGKHSMKRSVTKEHKQPSSAR